MKHVRIWLLATGVLIALHLSTGNIANAVEDVVLALVLVQYYGYRSRIEYFDERIRPTTFDGG